MPNIDNLNNEGEKLQDNNENLPEHSLDEIQETTDRLSSLTRQKAEEIRLEISPEDPELLEELEVVLEEEQELKSKLDAQLKIEYDNLLRQPMPRIGTKEYQERQNAIAHDISQRAYIIKSKIDEFTYFEELDDYIKNNPLFKPEDINFAKNVLEKIKEKIPKQEIDVNKHINKIKNDIGTKNLFRIYLMINRLIGQKETSVTNLLNKEPFENILVKSKNTKDIFSLDIFRNKDIQEYLKQDFNPEEYKKYYKEFTEQRLLAENKDNVKKYIKIQSIINSKEWQEMWNNVA